MESKKKNIRKEKDMRTKVVQGSTGSEKVTAFGAVSKICKDVKTKHENREICHSVSDTRAPY